MLCTPPAFILSQDQTLEIIVLKHPSGWFNLLSSLALSFFTFVWVVFSSVRIFEIRSHILFICFVLLSCCSIFNDHFSRYPLLRTAWLLYHIIFRLSIPFWKVFQKNSKNPLTDKDRVWYNSQAVRKRAAGSLKIEQQEISTKRKSKCESRRKKFWRKLL